MAATTFESREAQLRKDIEAEAERIRLAVPFALPGMGSPLVANYVEKIQGTYDVARAKTDTENAIDLLYIAYNTTPQEEGEVRVKINAIIDSLIKAQQTSELTLREAMGVSETVLSSLKNLLPDWQDVKDGKDTAEIKSFVAQDLLQLAQSIKGKALGIKDKLLAIATTYDAIIADTVAATAISEKALSTRLHDKARIEKEIVEAGAERDRLDSLVKELQEEVQKFDKLARDYQQRAETAENRAFFLQLTQVIAQAISAAIPPIAMAVGAASTGGASVIGASALNTVNKVTANNGGKDKPAGETTDTEIKTKEDISKKKKELETVEKEVNALKEKTTSVRKELNKAENKEADPAEAVVGEDEEKPEDSGAVKGLKEKLKNAKKDLETKEDQKKKIVGALGALQASLDALAQGLKEMSAEQKDQAATLREIQMKMLDKAEAYEKERRNQAADLIKIKALLTGKRTEEETIQLAIKSLNISLSALKRTKEIVEEIAFFFKSFADFMDQVAGQSQIEIELLEGVATSQLRKNALENLVKSTDLFFITQNAEWNAAIVVSDKFNKSFADGWQKLNTLSGSYITGEKLTAYLQEAAVLLQKISDERQKAASARILELDKARAALRLDAVKGATAA